MTRLLLAVLVALLVLTVMRPSQWCAYDAEGQLPLTPRELTQYDFIQQGYARQIERLWTLLYEGYLTRPGQEAEEDIKFQRGLRMARKAKQRAQEMVFKEPWEIIPPLRER